MTKTNNSKKNSQKNVSSKVSPSKELTEAELGGSIINRQPKTGKSQGKESFEKKGAPSTNDSAPTIKFQEVDLDELEPDEAIGELFEKINPLTIPSVIFGVILLIISYTVTMGSIGTIIVGFAGGLAFVFGCSELIILGVKGIARKLNWSEYFMGIFAAIGADLSDLVVVTILLLKGKGYFIPPEEYDAALGSNLVLTSITYILTTVLINTLILGITMMIVAKKKPFKLPNELSFTESNVGLAMVIFSFILMTFGLVHDAIDVLYFNRAFEGVIGFSLLLFYVIFVIFLIGDAKKNGGEKLGPQALISEYFPEEEEEEKEEMKIAVKPEDVDDKNSKNKKPIRKFFHKTILVEDNEEKEEGRQFIALRRFPWYILLLVFAVGIFGIIFGGNMISNSIEVGLSQFNIPILAYVVAVGLVSSAPELTITFRAIFDKQIENIQIGIVHQVSSINQTFFILFGFPFLFSAIIGIIVPVALDTTLVFAGIFIISLSLHLTIIDDNKFDRLEGALVTIAAITSLLALAIMGSTLP